MRLFSKKLIGILLIIEKMGYLFIFLFIINTISFANEEKIKITVEEDGKVITQKGNWLGVTYKVPKEKVRFDLGFILHDFKDTPKNLYSIYPRCDYLKDVWITLVVYDNNGIRGSNIYYCPQDSGVYVEDVIPTHVTKYSMGGWITKYYRIGEGKVENNKLIISFLEGTWFSYRRKKPFLVNPKDTNWLTIHIPKDLNIEVTEDYFRNDKKH